MKLIHYIPILLLSGFLKAQTYAPDTSFKFQNALVDFTGYKIQYVEGGNSKVILAYVEFPATGINVRGRCEYAAIDRSGNIIDTYSGRYITNSLTEKSFLYTTDSSVYQFNLETKEKKRIEPEGKNLNIEKIENDRIITKESVAIPNSQQAFSYVIYDLQLKRLAVVSSSYLDIQPNSGSQFNISALRVDANKNIWISVIKVSNDKRMSLQLYKMMPQEKELTNNHLVFEKSDNDLLIGDYEPPFGRYTAFIGDTLVVKREINQGKDYELRKIDFSGTYLSFKVILPRSFNRSFFLKTNTSKSITIFNEYSGEGIIVDEKGNVKYLKGTNVDYKFEVKCDSNSLYYRDKWYRFHEIDLTTLEDNIRGASVPTGRFEGQISFIQSLNNSEYWIGYTAPLTPYTWPADNSRFFVKYRRGKEIFRFPKVVKQFFYIGGNTVAVQTKEGKKVLIDGNNNQTELSQIAGELVYADTIHKHIYATDSNQLSRYSFDGISDKQFTWEGGKLRTNIVVTDDGKVYHAGARFEANGKKDSSFEEKSVTETTSLVPIFHLRKVWNTVFLFDGRCIDLCAASAYLTDQNSGKYIKAEEKIGYNPSYEVYENIIGRDSLLLIGLNKILPNLKMDSSVKIKGRFKDSFNKVDFRIGTNKWIDVLPNHDLLVALDNKLYYYTTQNPLWVEIRKLPDEIVLTDSLKKNGLRFETFSSDGSEVEVKIRSEYYEYSSGLIVTPTYSLDKVGRLEGKKLLLGGQSGRLTLVAQSRNAGQPYYKQVNISYPSLKYSDFWVKDTTLYIDFKPFPLSFIASDEVKSVITAKAEGEGGYLKDGIIYPTGKPGTINITLSHGATEKYASALRTFFWKVNRYSQTISYEGLTPDDNTYVISDKRFPFKIQGSASSGLPLSYSLVDKNLITDKLFEIRGDVVYLQPNYESILIENGYDKLDKPIQVVVTGNQTGNDQFNPVSSTFSIIFNYWIGNLQSPAVTVFPNPFINYFYVATEEDYLSDVLMLDLSGREVYRLKAEKQMELGTTSTKKFGSYFPVTNIPKGTYLLVYYIRGKKYVQKIVK